MKASERQVGGSHYQADYQHWDYCIEVNVPYLEAAASKYVLRWRKKNGYVDLEKSVHYIEKRLESLMNMRGIIRAAHKNKELFAMMCAANDSTEQEREIMDLTMHWKNMRDLRRAKEMIEEMLQQDQMRGYVNQG